MAGILGGLQSLHTARPHEAFQPLPGWTAHFSGAGHILGREQSGSINRIGLNLYCQMLNEAVEELKKEA